MSTGEHDGFGTAFVLPAKAWIRVGGTGVTTEDAVIELYSDEPVRLRYRLPSAARLLRDTTEEDP